MDSTKEFELKVDKDYHERYRYGDYYIASDGRIIKDEDINSEKEEEPVITLQSCNFSNDTRIAKLEFLQTQKYRTIDKYITRDYVKYPVYSYWKTRTKTIKKTIKLTNQALENLENNGDSLIAIFAPTIINALNNDDLRPSWYLHKLYLKEYKDTLQKLIQNRDIYVKSQNTEIKRSQSRIKDTKLQIEKSTKIMQKEENRLIKTNSKLDKIQNLPKSIIKSIFTLGAYSYLRSNSRINKYNIKKNKYTANIEQHKADIKRYNDKIEVLNTNITLYKKNIEDKEKELDTNRKKGYNELAKKVHSIKPLPTSIDEITKFTPLKSFNGLGSNKIMGCYIIHNVINNKHYVGQSKDITKRIRQHFNGTVPNNIIFAEDYYSTPVDQRDDLFEVNVQVCCTKDELDQKERDLIEEYDAYRSGYNKTGGNT